MHESMKECLFTWVEQVYEGDDPNLYRQALEEAMAEDAVVELLEHWRSIPIPSPTTINPDQPDPIANLRVLADKTAALRREIEAAVEREKARKRGESSSE